MNRNYALGTIFWFSLFMRTNYLIGLVTAQTLSSFSHTHTHANCSSFRIDVESQTTGAMSLEAPRGACTGGLQTALISFGRRGRLCCNLCLAETLALLLPWLWCVMYSRSVACSNKLSLNVNLAFDYILLYKPLISTKIIVNQ